MKTLITVSNVLISAILDGVPLSDLEKRQLIEGVGLSEARIRDFNARTSILTLARFWNEILRLTGNDFIGLQIGKSIPGERFGLAVHAAQNSDDFRQMLTRFSKYAGLINDLIKCALEEGSGKAHFTMKFYWDVLGLERHAVDITFSAVNSWALEHFGSKFRLHEVRFKHSLRHSQSAYEGIFKAPIVYAAARNELIFDAKILDENIPKSNQELGLILDHYASAEVAKIPILTDLPSRVSQILRRELQKGESVNLTSVSEELKMTTRHLQRSLNESSTSFSDLLDETRKSLAPVLLVQASANVEQVGFQLGYSEPTAFIRAFKKWYGMTPGQYRRTKSP